MIGMQKCPTVMHSVHVKGLQVVKINRFPLYVPHNQIAVLACKTPELLRCVTTCGPWLIRISGILWHLSQELRDIRYLMSAQGTEEACAAS